MLRSISLSASVRSVLRLPVCSNPLFKSLSPSYRSCMISRSMDDDDIPPFVTLKRGANNTETFRLYIADPRTSKPISAFHDIPYLADVEKKYFNMVVEIPRWSNAKMEISTKDALNPIKQDTKNGALRFVKNVFPHHGYIWNYGAIPQTWENPNQNDPETGYKGDNDPIDVCEIGAKIHERASVVPVKVLGCLGLIDEGETDWKIIVIDVTDPIAPQLNNIEDVERLMPGLLRGTYEWFKLYKIPDGKPANQFAFNGNFKNRDFALKVVEETHKQWQELMDGKVPNTHNISLTNATFPDHEHYVEHPEQIVNGSPIYIPGQPFRDAVERELNRSHFLDPSLK